MAADFPVKFPIVSPMTDKHCQKLYHKKYGLTATVYFDRLRHNIRIVKKHLPSRCQIIAIIKSDGYGHGSVQMAREFIKNGITFFAVLDIDEALELRKFKINSPVLVLSHIPQEYADAVVANNLTPSISSLDFAEALSREALKQKKMVNVHIKVDTGMGRFGIPPQQVISFIQKIVQLPCIKIEGIFSHLSSTFSDDVQSNLYTELQIDTFNRLLNKLHKKHILPSIIHLGSSTSLIGFSKKVTEGFFNAIRIGTLFLGFAERSCKWQDHPIPICEIQTKILTVKKVAKGSYIGYDRQYQTSEDLTIAILPIGYANGLHRALSNSGKVYILQQPCLIIGKISLGNAIVNISGTKHAKENTLVGLFGEKNSAYEQGQRIQRGTWEILLPLLQHCDTIQYSG
jgi:alanine racemase